MGESALSVVARMVARPALFKNYSVFQEEGLKNKEIVEVTGETGSGKSLILLDLISICILPKEFGGYEADVILIDTDCQFSIFQLVSMLESTIFHKINGVNPQDAARNEISRKIIEDCLSRLKLFTCYDLEKMFLRFHYFKTFLIGNPSISVVLLDNISTFYWKELQTNKEFCKMDSYVTNIINYFHAQLSSFNVSLIYTLPSHFQCKSNLQTECSDSFNLKGINTVVNLNQFANVDETIYIAEVKKCNNSYMKSFKVVNNCRISWL